MERCCRFRLVIGDRNGAQRLERIESVECELPSTERHSVAGAAPPGSGDVSVDPRTVLVVMGYRVKLRSLFVIALPFRWFWIIEKRK